MDITYGVVYSYRDFLAGTGIPFQIINKTSDYLGCNIVAGVVEFIFPNSDRSPVQFIWCPNACSREQVLTSFDITVCQIGYDVLKQEFFMLEGVQQDLQNATARVTRNFHFAGSVPTVDEARSLTSPLRRMRKYESKGYQFSGNPVMTFD